MDTWWVGTVSALAGAITAALLQSWRERIAYKRELHTRWDESLLVGVVDYLSTADRALRALVRWRDERDVSGADSEAMAADALAAFEQLHEKSQVISLLTGGRTDPVRQASREMREPLVLLRDEVLGNARLDDAQAKSLNDQHRDARTRLLEACQHRLGVSGEDTSPMRA